MHIALIVILALGTGVASGALEVSKNGVQADLSKLKNGQAVYVVNK